MHKLYRRTLMGVSLVVFLLVSPLIILYAMGYRFDFTNQQSITTGVAVFQSVPNAADVVYSGKFIGRTPEAITGLTVHEIPIEVSLAGYNTWSKNVPIQRAAVNEYRNIRLFPLNPKPLSLETNVSQFSLSPSRRLIALITENNQLSVIDVIGEEEVLAPIATGVSPTSLLWSPDNTRILVSYPNGKTDMISIADTNPVLAPLPQLTNATDISWDPRLASRLLFIDAEKNLTSLSLINNKIVVLRENVVTFSPDARRLYLVTNDQLLVTNLQGITQQQINTTLEDGEAVNKIIISPAGAVALRTDRSNLYIYDHQENNTPFQIASNLKATGWSPNGRLLYVQTDQSELHVYNHDDETTPWLSTDKPQFIVRHSRPITHPQWFAGGHHLIYQIDDRIVVTEIDTRDRPISHTLASTNLSNSQVAVGEDGESVVFLQVKNNQSELINLSLVVEE